MPITLLKQVIDSHGRTYELTVSLEDPSVTPDGGTLPLAVTARHRASQSQDERDWREIAVQVAAVFDHGPHRIEVSVEGRLLTTIHLDDLPPPDASVEDDAAPTRPESSVQDSSSFLDQISEALRENHDVEELIELFPAGDPLLGCLIRSGVSTAVGQIIRCYQSRDLRTERRFGVLLDVVASCLRQNGRRMLGTFAWRFGRCLLRGGW